jgi:hypothetical protein
MTVRHVFADARLPASGGRGTLCNTTFWEVTMHAIGLGVALALLATPALAQYGTGSNPGSHPTSGYTKGDGTYVQPYQSTNPNNTQRDNYGATGNYNPYTGKTGTKPPKY